MLFEHSVEILVVASSALLESVLTKSFPEHIVPKLWGYFGGHLGVFWEELWASFQKF